MIADPPERDCSYHCFACDGDSEWYDPRGKGITLLDFSPNTSHFFDVPFVVMLKGLEVSFERVQWLISTYLEQKQTDKQTNITVDLIRFSSEVTF